MCIGLSIKPIFAMEGLEYCRCDGCEHGGAMKQAGIDVDQSVEGSKGCWGFVNMRRYAKEPQEYSYTQSRLLLCSK